MFRKFNWLWHKKNFLNFRLAVFALILISAAVGVYFVSTTGSDPGDSRWIPPARAASTTISVSAWVGPLPACNDGADNDGDGLIDYPDDPGCDDFYDDDEYNLPACSDGIDNDGDGFIDFPDDHGCDNPSDTSESGEPACNDGLDNDSDGLIDYPDDPGCESLIDNDEYNAPPSGPGGPGIVLSQTLVIISGQAYPLAKVTILKDGQITTIIQADIKANFRVTLTTITPGSQTFGILAEDSEGRKSPVFNFTINIAKDMTTSVRDILLPPTIGINKPAVKKGEILNIFGQTAPGSDITALINSLIPGALREIIRQTKAETSGKWFYGFDTGVLAEEGFYNVKAKAEWRGSDPQGGSDPLKTSSALSRVIPFFVGLVPPPEIPILEKCPHPADINRDGKVNLVDFSILLYNWGTPKSELADLNCDNKVNLRDFSIMLFYWTG